MSGVGGISPDGMAREFGLKITALSRRMIRSASVAADAAQEAWVQILRSLPGFKGRSNLSTWVYTVARRAILTVARKERTYSARHISAFLGAGDLKCPAPDEEGKAEWIRLKCDRCLTAFLTCLEPRARLAVLFRDLVELSYSELAAVMGESQSSIRQTVSRSRRKLRNYLTDNCRLFKPDADCRCRLRKYPREIDRLREYTGLKRAVRLGMFLKKTGRLAGIQCHKPPSASTQ